MSYDPKVTQRGFPRINNQLNYERTFLSPEKVRVTIPTLHFRAFDKSGTKVAPWEVCRLITAIRSFTNWPVAHSGNPLDSLADTHKLIEKDFLFIASMQIDISESFHKIESPKFPLHIDVELTHCGRSSSRKIYTLFHEKSDCQYAVCQIDDVLVDGKSRKPMAFPTWWKEKFVHISKGPKEAIGEWSTENELVKVSKEEYVVIYNDIDTNQHTNYSTYIKFCYDSIFKAVMDNTLSAVTGENLEKGVKTLAMTFHGETNYRDLLTVDLWEDPTRLACAFCSIKTANDKQCCTLFFEFYSQDGQNIAGKL